MKPFALRTLNVLVPVVLALATNGLIFALGWNQPDNDIQPDFAPPGYVIGIVWTVLFACMGAARWRALGDGDAGGAKWIAALILLCLAYPFYTLGLQDRMAGLAGIAVTGTLTLYIVFRGWNRSRSAALLLLPLIGWLFFAAMLIQAVNELDK